MSLNIFFFKYSWMFYVVSLFYILVHFGSFWIPSMCECFPPGHWAVYSSGLFSDGPGYHWHSGCEFSTPRDSLWTVRVSIDNQQSQKSDPTVGPTGPLDTPQNLRISDSS